MIGIGITAAADGGSGELILRGRRKYPARDETLDSLCPERMVVEGLTPTRTSCTSSAIACSSSIVSMKWGWRKREGKVGCD